MSQLGQAQSTSEAQAQINRDRRRFLRNAAMTIAAVEFGITRSAAAQSRTLTPIKRGTHTSFGSLKQIDAGLLNLGYADAGPANAPAVLLLHGWPYDIHSYVDVARCWHLGATAGGARPMTDDAVRYVAAGHNCASLRKEA